MRIEMPFNPKAQILLQLGEQLIKSESVAILELIKNSYDADATQVNVSMMHIDNPQAGYIEIADNGYGMDLNTVKNIWMEPGNAHKKGIVEAAQRSPLGRLPIGEKGIGRFGAHKLGKKIEMITKAADSDEIRVYIDWHSFETAKYLSDVNVSIEQRPAEFFVDGRTGTKLFISDLSTTWTRAMLRKAYRAIASLSSPFDSDDAFRVEVKTDKKKWIEGLLTFDKIRKYALYNGKITISGSELTSFEYKFLPFDNMAGLKERRSSISAPVRMVKEVKNESGKREQQEIDIGKYNIGDITIDLMVFDRDSAIRARFIEDKRTYGSYLDENGGIRVFRDGVRIYDYGEPGNDWLELDSKRINTPGKYLSNNLILGAVKLNREKSSDLQEKANREGFIENSAYFCFRDAVKFAIDYFTTQRNIDKETLRQYLNGGRKEPIVHDVSLVRKRVAEVVKDESARKEIDGFLKRIETDYAYIQKMYLKTASAGMSYGVVIHEIEKVISELSSAVEKETASNHIIGLAKHLSKLVDSYADLLRSRAKTHISIKKLINQAEFSLQYRLDAHNIELEKVFRLPEDATVYCASNLIVGSIINIIDNSIWWTTYAKVPQKCVYIASTDELNGFPAIIIADNGCGFTLSPEDVIKPFVTTKPNGMGLGLNIVNEIMASQGGTLVFPDVGDVELPEKYKNGAVVALVFKGE